MLGRGRGDGEGVHCTPPRLREGASPALTWSGEGSPSPPLQVCSMAVDCWGPSSRAGRSWKQDAGLDGPKGLIHGRGAQRSDLEGMEQDTDLDGSDLRQEADKILSRWAYGSDLEQGKGGILG
ncbi:hypothetical protein KIL84_003844 [Mauremys mutica]|uniref:Uncharacterized protein n=1 Tax=Mauremys mutica TaxID=74926 RepID=A0A9D4ATW9_9SAUR|nr:hypothetical protein KIL84_003844 [Mauremys mutica]